MINNSHIKQLYSQIQNDLINLIPEKWTKICLYASFPNESINNLNSEMFFYYYPKSILKRNPINAYEIPKRFHIIEEDYLKLITILHEQIKLIREEFILSDTKIFTNITIIIEQMKFKIIYNYENLNNSDFNSYERHIIWQYKYLGIDSQNYSRNEKRIIQKYLSLDPFELDVKREDVYEENIYLSSSHKGSSKIKEEYIKELNITMPKEKNIKTSNEELEEDIKEVRKNQILNTNIF